MASTKQYWMFTRPHRKLIRAPKSIAAFAAVALGDTWERNRSLQMRFEDELEHNGLKAVGEHTERDRGDGGSGGRTHAALLYSLGLFFTYKVDQDADEEVHLTWAGQALVDQEDALPVLRRQVLAHQFPSPYSIAIRVDERFRLRPFVLLLRLLRDPDLDGYLADSEIAAAVVPYAEAHTAAEAKRIKERVLAFRKDGLKSLDADFADQVGIAGDDETLWKHIYKSDGKLGAIANTAAQWLRYTGFAQPSPGEDHKNTAKTVTAVNPNLLEEIDAAIAEWGAGTVDGLKHMRDALAEVERLMRIPKKKRDADAVASAQLTAHRAAAAFQRTYGRTPDRQKDTRKLGDLRQASQKARTTGLVTAAVVHLFQAEPVLAVTDEVVSKVVNHTGLDEKTVRTTLSELIRTPQEGLSQFLDRYQQMAFAGTDEAIAFEKATAAVIEEVFGIRSRQVGQAGRVPDVEVLADDWTGIIDTKAYPAYDLPSDHQLRMQTSYVPAYKGKDPDLAFFMYVAGGFAPSFNAKLSLVTQAADVPGSGIGILPWIELIRGYEDSPLDHEGLRELWSIGREITAQDVAGTLSKAA